MTDTYERVPEASSPEAIHPWITRGEFVLSRIDATLALLYLPIVGAAFLVDYLLPCESNRGGAVVVIYILWWILRAIEEMLVRQYVVPQSVVNRKLTVYVVSCQLLTVLTLVPWVTVMKFSTALVCWPRVIFRCCFKGLE